jgi:hypothetical protein
MFFVLKFELILIIGSNNVLTEGARKAYRGRRVGQGYLTVKEDSLLRSKCPLLVSILSEIDTAHIPPFCSKHGLMRSSNFGLHSEILHFPSSLNEM